MTVRNLALLVDSSKEPRISAEFFPLRLGHTMGMDLIEATNPRRASPLLLQCTAWALCVGTSARVSWAGVRTRCQRADSIEFQGPCRYKSVAIVKTLDLPIQGALQDDV